MGLTMVQRTAVLVSQVAAWPKATKAEKSAILDHLVAVNGWHRDHVRKMIRAAVASRDTARAVGQRRAARAPVFTYDEAAVAALATCWAVLGGPTGKRLQPALAALVPALVAHGELPEDPAVIDQVLSMSAATIDRRLKDHRVGLVAAKGRSLTRPGSLLRASIPLKTWHEWDDARPGFLEIDLVGHEGGDANGDFHYTLDATDVATGWTEAISIASKGERTVSAALTRLQLRFPFAVLGIHSDNGSEFINHHLLKWATDREITFTRGRPSHSNDQAHVEQKNWTNVRHAVGYHRYDTPRELALLNELWPLQSQLTNLFLPQQKLISKTRDGAKVTKKYDKAATPATRLARDHPDVLTPTDTQALRHQLDDLNPAGLARRIAAVQASLLELARRRGTIERRAKTNAVYLTKKKIKPPAAPRALTDESTTPPTRAS
jgi:hypothetical protein